ncbi:MAG: hypothetical protein AVDCRST_MAG41-735, partial [uncultured Corynebacteriales bacterium]
CGATWCAGSRGLSSRPVPGRPGRVRRNRRWRRRRRSRTRPRRGRWWRSSKQEWSGRCAATTGGRPGRTRRVPG